MAKGRAGKPPPGSPTPDGLLGCMDQVVLDDVLASLSLSERQSDVVRLLLHDGRSRADLAEALGISIGTMNTHCERIHAKLGIQRRADLLRRIIKEYLLRVAPPAD